MHQIEVNNITIDVVRKDIKNMYLAVYPPTGRVRIAAPLRINDKAVRLFAISKLSWIKKINYGLLCGFESWDSHIFQPHAA